MEKRYSKDELFAMTFPTEWEYKEELSDVDFHNIIDLFYINLVEEKASHKRVNKCTAWEVFIPQSKRFTALRSYDTIVGICDNSAYKYYSLGRYSSTTYQHERKFLNNKMFFDWDCNPCDFRQINLHYYDGFDYGTDYLDNGNRYYKVTK